MKADYKNWMPRGMVWERGRNNSFSGSCSNFLCCNDMDVSDVQSFFLQWKASDVETDH